MNKYHLAPVCVLIITSLFLASCPSQDAPDDGGEAATHTITFVKNDAGATGTMESQTVTEGASAVLASNAFAKGSWGFRGWAATPDGEAAYADGASFTMGNADVTLYATWALKFTVAYLNQCSSSWGSHLMGTSSTDTICSTGTALTAVAMILSAEDPAITPDTLNTWLTGNSGYVIECSLLWTAIDAYPGTAYRYAGKKAFTGLADLKAELDLGNPVIFSLTSSEYRICLSYINDGSAPGDYAYYKTMGSTAVEYTLSTTDIANMTYLYPYHR
jgi:hypothetical protein